MVNVVYRLICAQVFQIFLGILANRCVILRMFHLYHCGVLQNFLGEKKCSKNYQHNSPHCKFCNHDFLSGVTCAIKSLSSEYTRAK